MMTLLVLGLATTMLLGLWLLAAIIGRREAKLRQLHEPISHVKIINTKENDASI